MSYKVVPSTTGKFYLMRDGDQVAGPFGTKKAAAKFIRKIELMGEDAALGKAPQALNEKGQTTVEYLLIIAVIVAVISVINKNHGSIISKILNGVYTKMENVIGAGLQ